MKCIIYFLLHLGKNCEINDKSSPGGIDRTGGRYEIVDIVKEKRKCVQNNCEAKAGDNRCHEECNTHVCNYDGGDCRLGLNPWKFCNVTIRSRQRKSCWDVFQVNNNIIYCMRDKILKTMISNPSMDMINNIYFNATQLRMVTVTRNVTPKLASLTDETVKQVELNFNAILTMMCTALHIMLMGNVMNDVTILHAAGMGWIALTMIPTKEKIFIIRSFLGVFM